ncbi:MAG: family N-acetyltransferase [Blastococcus sp.]|nr:family N-acetyltransferase [Blastococcus sp.]
MDIPIRRANAADFDAVAELDGASFGFQYSGDELTDALTIIDPERFFIATDGERIVGVTGDYPFTMTVPGGALDVPGVTWVSVDATYRRRGILRELMQRQLTDYREQGVPAAILTASEGGIYGRFGYGAASRVRKTVLDRRRVKLVRPGEAGAVTRATTAQARELIPAIHDRWRAQTPGALNRTDAWWDLLCLDREYQRNGMSGLFFLLHDDGFVSYRIKSDWGDGDPRHLCWIVDYVIASPEAHSALWQVLLGLDLVGTIESFRIPIDDPLPLVVNDARQVQTKHVGDGVWVRPLDVPAMLSARRYAIELDTVIEVVDDLFGDGRYWLRGGPDAATCTPTDRAADVVLDAAALGSVYLGGSRLEALARAGAVGGDDPRRIARLDRALLADREPVHGTAF